MTEQERAEKALYKRGFRFAHKFPFDSWSGDSGDVLILTRKRGMNTHQAEIDPDGTVNGETLESYLRRTP